MNKSRSLSPNLSSNIASHKDSLEGEGDGISTGVGLFNKFWMKVVRVGVGLPWPKLKRRGGVGMWQHFR